MRKEAWMELKENFAFEFTALGVDYVAYQHPATAMFLGKTRIYDLEMSEDKPVLEFSGTLDRIGCEAAMVGFKIGLKEGELIGAKSVKRAFQQLLDLPSLEDVEALDGRMDRLCKGAAR